MNDDRVLPPAFSIIIVTLGGLDDLAVPLPGLRSQTMAGDIELIIVAEPGRISAKELLPLTEFHSIRIIDCETITNRGKAAAFAVAVAQARFVGLHENHTRAEPETYERLLAEFSDEVGAVCPVMYAANAEMAWGIAMYTVAHGHATPPARTGPRPFLAHHQAVFSTDFLKKHARELANEELVQAAIIDDGLELRIIPGTVVWHINEARPSRVMIGCFLIGRKYGYHRSRQMGMVVRLLRALLWPAILGNTIFRLLREARRTPEARHRLLISTPAVTVGALCFATGEVFGYFCRSVPRGDNEELHEFHVRGRLAGGTPAKRWLRDAVTELPNGAP